MNRRLKKKKKGTTAKGRQHIFEEYKQGRRDVGGEKMVFERKTFACRQADANGREGGEKVGR